MHQVTSNINPIPDMYNDFQIPPEDIVELDSDQLYFDWTDNNPHQGEFTLYNPGYSPYALCGSGGMGGGKTVGLVRRTILHMINTPMFGNLNGNVGCIGRLKRTDFERTTLPELKKWLPPDWIANEDKKLGRLDLVNGSTLYYAHFDDISPIVSLNLGFVAIDQMEEIPVEVFKELFYHRIRLKTLKRYREDGSLINPTFDLKGVCTSTDLEELATVFTGQNVFGVCNPKQCWIINKFVKNRELLSNPDPKIQARYNKSYKLIEIPTAENQRYVPVNYISQQKADLSDKEYGRYVLGSWDCWEGQIYVDFIDSCINKTNIVPNPTWDLYVGIDHGGTGLDSTKATGVTAVVFLAVEPRPGDYPKVHVFDELYLQSSTIEDTVAAIDETLKKIYTQQYWASDGVLHSTMGQRATVQVWRCDPSMNRKTEDGSETICDRYIRLAAGRGIHMPLTPGSNDVTDNIERVSWMFRKGILDVNPKCISTIDEHKGWEYGKNEKPKPMQRDHTCNSVQYITSALPFATNRVSAPSKSETMVDKIFAQAAVKQAEPDYEYEVY